MLTAALRHFRAVQAAERLRAGELYSVEPGWMFANEVGDPYSPSRLGRWFHQRAEAAGLRRIRLHDTRHTAASLMLADGVPVPVVAELLGHSSANITLSFYAHAVPGQSATAGAALSASLLGSLP
jgi:integrase